MKNSIRFKLFLTLFLFMLIMPGCEKKSSDSKNLLGTWISTDLIDTVEFRTDHDFYKTVGVPNDHFNYTISGDSMTIQYDGALYIYVLPKNHYYKLNSNSLTIDLNQCYGFRNQVITFSKK
jgi:hypothetical protein